MGYYLLVLLEAKQALKWRRHSTILCIVNKYKICAFVVENINNVFENRIVFAVSRDVRARIKFDLFSSSVFHDKTHPGTDGGIGFFYGRRENVREPRRTR